MEAGFLVFRCDLVPHLLCQYDRDDSCLSLLTCYLPKSAINKKTHLCVSLGKRKNRGSPAAVIFISVAKQVRKIDKINHTN